MLASPRVGASVVLLPAFGQRVGNIQRRPPVHVQGAQLADYVVDLYGEN